jgi:acyl-CoA thioesterase FadM
VLAEVRVACLDASSRRPRRIPDFVPESVSESVR